MAIFMTVGPNLVKLNKFAVEKFVKVSGEKVANSVMETLIRKLALPSGEQVKAVEAPSKHEQ